MTERAPLASIRFLLLLLSACGSPQAATTGSDREPPPTPLATSPVPTPSAGRIVDGFWVTSDAPAPLSCVADTDCAADGTVDATGCCWSYRDMNVTAQSRAYESFIAAHRAEACAGVPCPSPPVPTQPPDCLFEVRCDASSGVGLCTNACSPMVPSTS